VDAVAARGTARDDSVCEVQGRPNRIGNAAPIRRRVAVDGDVDQGRGPPPAGAVTGVEHAAAIAPDGLVAADGAVDDRQRAGAAVEDAPACGTVAGSLAAV